MDFAALFHSLWTASGSGVTVATIDPAGKNSGGQINRLFRKKAGLQETSLVFHLSIFVKSFSFWTSLPSFWLPFVTPFKDFSSFSRAENFFRATKAPLPSNLLLLSKNLAREP
ncbi:MAG TPA: hypothetical protein VEG25_02515 [Burkholderiales bacterium]|nr:hypothetical protein [Burkholderiales bacterium]